ncbi:phosphotransferase family protein [Parasphingopyxis marina]|uniref:Phosphotransferase n=1 Tax=Parasphingopyxis marina TaxID=2761622 RepID=A0A842I186_9SPHN|nr:aminoglycoside phosphotransferase family protein [Parasphingopyxis marina]MBC2778992.1 phosphotransferase [Parasphingopyxis marina]
MIAAVIPTRPEQFSRGWLEERLGAPAGSLRGFTARTIGTGQMCDSFRLALDWANHDGPATIVAKCPSANADSRQIARTVHTYMREVSWYRDLAGEIPVSCPRCFHAEIAEDEVEFALLLEDMEPAAQGDQLAGATIAEIESAIAEAAKLQAPLWNNPRLGGYAWLAAQGNREIVRALMPKLYMGFEARYRDRLAPEIHEMGRAFVERLDGFLDYEPPTRTVVHGDFRIDNLLFHPETGAVTVIDWQTVGIGTGASDIAYLIGTSIADPARRAAEEARLLRDYAARLEAQGVETDGEQLWFDYRRGAFSGFVMAIFASMNVQRTPRGDEMFAVMAERPAWQILHLDSLSLL